MIHVPDGLARLGWRWPALGLALVLALSAGWWGPAFLSHLVYFRVRHVRVEGQRFIDPRDVVARMRVDTTMSVWTDLAPLARRVETLPQVREARITRNLPGTLVVHLVENVPVAFVPSPAGLRAVDASGRVLPIDPSRAALDVPVVARADPGLLSTLDTLRLRWPGLFAELGSVERTGTNELTIELPSLRVLALPGVTARRLADIIPVTQDLARRHVRAVELDLRFRDQVVARLQ